MSCMFNCMFVLAVFLFCDVVMKVPEVAKGIAFTSIKYLSTLLICRKSIKKPWN